MPLLGREKVDDMIERSVKKTNEDLRGVFLAGLKNIIQETPVDEGRARNNWFLSVGAPFSMSDTSTNLNGSRSERSALTMPKKVTGKKIFFSNNLPYITTLEYGGYPNPVEKGSYIKRSKSYEKLSSGGFSLQAPNGWVRATLIDMQNKVRNL